MAGRKQFVVSPPFHFIHPSYSLHNKDQNHQEEASLNQHLHTSPRKSSHHNANNDDDDDDESSILLPKKLQTVGGGIFSHLHPRHRQTFNIMDEVCVFQT